MRFFHTFTVGFLLLSGIFANRPHCTVMATPAPKTIEENHTKSDKKGSPGLVEVVDPASETGENTRIFLSTREGTQKEKLVQSKEVTDPANEKKENTQISTAEKPKASSVPTVDYDKMIDKQLREFLERDLPKNLADLPLEPIVTIALSNLPDGLKKVFFVGDKIYPGFSTLAQLFISGYLGGTDCPGIDPSAPCHVLLFPDKINIVAPLVCFKATPESLIVKNLQSEANRNGNWQLTPALPIAEKTYNIWMAAPKSLFSVLKDFSTVTALFDPTKERVRNLLSVELNIDSLSALMPLPVLKLIYDTYVKKDFEKIIFNLDTDEKGLKISFRYQVKPQMPWSVFCKAVNEKKKTFRSLNFPSEADTESVLCWDPSASKNLLNALSTYAKEAEWKRDPIAWQVYRWGQILYPLFETYLDFEETASVGNSQSYFLGAEWFGFEELKSTITDKALADFLDKFIKKCAYQLALAYNEHLLGSNYIESVSFGEKFLTHEDYGNIHRCGLKIRGYVPGKPDDSNELLLFVALYNGYLLYGNDLDRVAFLFEQLKALSPFSYCSRPEAIFSSRTEFEHPKGIIETSCNAEVAPEAFSTTASISLSFIEAVGSLIFGNTYSDKSKDKSEEAKETEKTNRSKATSVPSNVSEPTRAPRGEQNISNPAISDQPAAVR